MGVMLMVMVMVWSETLLLGTTYISILTLYKHV